MEHCLRDGAADEGRLHGHDQGIAWVLHAAHDALLALQLETRPEGGLPPQHAAGPSDPLFHRDGEIIAAADNARVVESPKRTYCVRRQIQLTARWMVSETSHWHAEHALRPVASELAVTR